MHLWVSLQAGVHSTAGRTGRQDLQQEPSTTTGFSPSSHFGTLEQPLKRSTTLHLRSGRLQDLQQPLVLWGFSPDAQVSSLASQALNSSLVHLPSPPLGGVNSFLQVGQQVSVSKDGLTPLPHAGRSLYSLAQEVLKPKPELSDFSPHGFLGGLQDKQQSAVRLGRSPAAQVANVGNAALQAVCCAGVHLSMGILHDKQPLSLRSGLVFAAHSAGTGHSGSSLWGLLNWHEGQQVSTSNTGRSVQAGRADISHAFTLSKLQPEGSISVLVGMPELGLQ